MGLFGQKSGELLEEEESPEGAAEQQATLHVGVPGRCPECGGFGYIDHIDMKYRTQTQHCRECRYSWEFSFDEQGDVLDLTDSTDAETSQSGAR